MKISIAIQKLIHDWNSPNYIMLVGPPGIGKSTFIKKLLERVEISNEPIHIASTDDIIEIKAAEAGLTYSEMFHQVNQKVIKREMEAGIELAFEGDMNIIHDQTNMSRNSRASKLCIIPDNYQKICVNFTVDDKILQQRLDDRAKLTGKIIPPFVMKSMLNNYEAPDKNEGFNLIIQVETN
jgi:tRNA uridine 5-carbamoylmethylation protein Kti12